jgi:hypothetical protein
MAESGGSVNPRPAPFAPLVAGLPCWGLTARLFALRPFAPCPPPWGSLETERNENHAQESKRLTTNADLRTSSPAPSTGIAIPLARNVLYTDGARYVAQCRAAPTGCWTKSRLTQRVHRRRGCRRSSSFGKLTVKDDRTAPASLCEDGNDRDGVFEVHRIHRLPLAGNQAVFHQRRDLASERVLTHPVCPLGVSPRRAFFHGRSGEANKCDGATDRLRGPSPGYWWPSALRARPGKKGRAAPSPSRPSPFGRSRAVSPTFARFGLCRPGDTPRRGPALTASPRSLARA